MPPKHTQRKKYEPPSPKPEPITLYTKNLEKALNSLVVVYVIGTGVPLRGQLRDFDKETIVIFPETTIPRDKIVAFYEAKNAPNKEVPRPPVR